MDIENLSLPELKSLQNDVAIAIADFKKRKRAEALAEVKAVAQAKGFSLDELLGTASTKSKRGPVPAKYADPANPDNTWSGRGRKPKWLVAQLDQGKSVEDFAL